MHLHCRLMPKNEDIQNSIVSRLEAMGHDPIIDSDGAVILDYDGDCSGTPLAIITVFESFGCDRVFVWKGETKSGEPTTRIQAKLGQQG